MRWTLLILALAVACSPPPDREGVTETGNPELLAGVTLRARSSDPGFISVRGDGEIDVDRLWMAVAGVRLFPRRACEELSVPSFVDAFVSDATAVVPQVQEGVTEATVYCGAQVSLDPTADAGDGPPEVEGASLYMTGMSEAGWPFRLRSSLAFTAPLSRDEGNFILDTSHDRLSIGIDVSIWMDEISIDDGVPDGTGTIVIDDSTNQELLLEFEAALLDAMDVEVD